LGGVFKLVGLKENGEWVPAIKISESPAKTPTPGDKQVWRIYDNRKKATADLIATKDEDPRQQDSLYLHHPSEEGLYRNIRKHAISEIEPLLADIVQNGKLVSELPTLEQMREQRHSDLERLDSGVKRLMNPHIYHVSLTKQLWKLKQELIQSVKNQSH